LIVLYSKRDAGRQQPLRGMKSTISIEIRT